MISYLGRGLVMASLFFATIGCISGYVAGSRRSYVALRWARNNAYGFAISMIAANLLMVYALLTHDFSVSYVAEVGSTTTPVYFTVVSLWASLNGSILFWGGILGVYVFGVTYAIGDKHREYLPWALHVLMGISLFFALLVASIANPFEPVFPVPLEGPGPNPLLQNHWLMAIHPPMLYMGYVGMSVPFSLICAALLAGRLEAGWMKPVRTWMLIPWGFLSVGIILGGWWSYAVLGWGGAWAWDPVENASFHPWLTGTAFIHSAMVLQRRNRMRDWTLVLGMSTFLLTLLGTFMTRSGVFNSVHSFTQSDIGPVFLYFIGFVLLYSVGLLALRSHTLDDEAKAADSRLGGKASRGGGLLTRETSILIQNALFTVFTFTVLLGTLYPLIAEALQEKRVSVGEPYFDKWALPIGLGIVFMMGIGPALPWGNLSKEAIGKRLGIPAVFGVVLFVVPFVFGGFDPVTPAWLGQMLGDTSLFLGSTLEAEGNYKLMLRMIYTAITFFTIGFAFWCNFNETLEPTLLRMKAKGENPLVAVSTVIKKSRRRFGGHVAHYGILMAVLALAMTKGYREEKDFQFTKDQTAEFHGFEIKYSGAKMVDETYRRALVATFDITENGVALGPLEPRMNYYPTQREPVYTPAVYEEYHGDLYLSLIEIPGDGQTAVLRIIYQPWQMWLWMAAPMIALGTLISVWPEAKKKKTQESAA